MPDLGDPIGEISGVIRTMLGLTRHSRLREQIQGTVELYNLTSAHEDLSHASADLAELITLQTSRLLEIASSTGRQWNWSSFIISWIFAGFFGWLAYLLWPHWGSWWGALLFLLVTVVGGLLAIAGVGVLLQQKSAEA